MIFDTLAKYINCICTPNSYLLKVTNIYEITGEVIEVKVENNFENFMSYKY